jgi:pantothenate kinase
MRSTETTIAVMRNRSNGWVICVTHSRHCVAASKLKFAKSYHIPRSRLDADAMRRRGAADTFDQHAFRAAVQSLHSDARPLYFASFDHAEKDPKQDAIVINDARIILVEGLYLFLQHWQLIDLFHLRVFLQCDIDVAIHRVALRHVKYARSVQHAMQCAILCVLCILH